VPWPHYPNKNVFSDRRDRLFGKSASLRCGGKLLHCVRCSEMDRLKRCQGTVLEESCGSSAADVLNDLFTVALHDPHYLRFGYRPDCRLHRAETATSAPPAVHPDVFSYSSVDGHIPAGHSRDRSSSFPPADTGERKERIYQTGSGRSAASSHQMASRVVFPVTLTLLTVSAARLRWQASRDPRCTGRDQNAANCCLIWSGYNAVMLVIRWRFCSHVLDF